jgi:hypothetical protein
VSQKKPVDLFEQVEEDEEEEDDDKEVDCQLEYAVGRQEGWSARIQNREVGVKIPTPLLPSTDRAPRAAYTPLPPSQPLSPAMTMPPLPSTSLPALSGTVTLTAEQFNAMLAAIQGAGATSTPKSSSRRHIAKPSTWNAVDGDPADWKLEVETFMRATNTDYTDDNERIATILSYLADDARLWARPILKKDPECMVTIKDVPVAAWDSVEAFWAFFDAEWTSCNTVERAEADIIHLYQKDDERVVSYVARMRSAFLQAKWSINHPAVWLGWYRGRG